MRWFLAWTFFWAGDAVSRSHNLFSDKESWDCVHGAIADIYQWLMRQSLKWQGPGPNGPWGKE